MTFDAGPIISKFDENELEALIELMYLAADSDGDFADAERSELSRSIAALAVRSRSAATLNAARVSSLLKRAQGDLGRDGLEARLASVKDRLGNAEARKAAIAMAIAIAASDGVVRTSEREFILDMAVALDVDQAEAADLVRHAVAARGT